MVCLLDLTFHKPGCCCCSRKTPTTWICKFLLWLLDIGIQYRRGGEQASERGREKIKRLPFVKLPGMCMLLKTQSRHLHPAVRDETDALPSSDRQSHVLRSESSSKSSIRCVGTGLRLTELLSTVAESS